MKKENSDSLKFLRNLLLLLSLYVKIANSNHRCLNLCFFIGQFNDFLNTIFFSSPTVALIVAVFLDNTLDYKDSAKDRGMPWWVKFRTFKGDTRNEEFYTLPFNLNRFFPPSWSSVILKEAVISRKEMITPSYCREDLRQRWICFTWQRNDDSGFSPYFHLICKFNSIYSFVPCNQFDLFNDSVTIMKRI